MGLWDLLIYILPGRMRSIATLCLIWIGLTAFNGPVSVASQSEQNSPTRELTGSTGQAKIIVEDIEERPATVVASPDIFARKLMLPVASAIANKLYDSFNDPRGRNRRHRAIDIMAPRRTPVYAVDDGTIVALKKHPLAGTSIYQLGPIKRYSFFYAHLDDWAPGLREGQRVEQGELLGFVGTTGNASDQAPHLHLAVYELEDPNRWWTGKAINPYLLFQPLRR